MHGRLGGQGHECGDDKRKGRTIHILKLHGSNSAPGYKAICVYPKSQNDDFDAGCLCSRQCRAAGTPEHILALIIWRTRSLTHIYAFSPNTFGCSPTTATNRRASRIPETHHSRESSFASSITAVTALKTVYSSRGPTPQLAACSTDAPHCINLTSNTPPDIYDRP